MKRLGAICTTWFSGSHADVILGRWLEPRVGDAAMGWADCGTRLESVYVLQPCLDDDEATRQCGGHGVALVGSVAEAMSGVDGVLLIAEHGDYPLNEFGQKLYPRRELFDEITKMMEESGSVVPLFFDKHLSWSPASIAHIDARRRALDLPMMAGSVLPYCETTEVLSEEVIFDAREAVCVYSGGQEIYGFHSLEFAQAHLERRRGGESGVIGIRTWRGEEMWEMLGEPGARRALLEASVEVNLGESGVDVRARTRVEREAPKGFHAKQSNSLPSEPVAFETLHGDGLRVLHVMLPGCVKDFSIAVRNGSGGVEATRAIRHGASDHFAHFARLAGRIAAFTATSEVPHSPARNVLTSLVLSAVMQSLAGADPVDVVGMTARRGYQPEGR